MKYFPRLTIALLSLIIAAFSTNAARNWTLQAVDGPDYTLADHLDGSPVLMLFWASWCKPCKEELAAFKETIDGFEASGVEVLLISIDTQRSKSRVKPYLNSKGYEWTALYDPNWDVLKMYGGTNKIPYTVLLDGTGSTYYKHLGEMKSIDELTTKIHELTGNSGD